MLEIVRWFRALLGLTVVAGLVIIVFASVAIADDQGIIYAVWFGSFAAAGLILTVGIAAAIVLATDYLQEIRDELREAAKRGAPIAAERLSPSLLPQGRRNSFDLGTSSARTKVKTYKGHLIERDSDGKICVGDKTFEGLLAAERYIRDQ